MRGAWTALVALTISATAHADRDPAAQDAKAALKRGKLDEALKDAFVLKYSAMGVLLWGVRWGDANDQAATHIAVTANDHVIVAGTYDGVIDLGPVQHESNAGTSTFIVELP